MIPLALDLLEPLGRLVARPWADEVTGMQVDSRRIAEGDLFVAVGGGSDFVQHALARGAAAALVPEDAFAALAAIAGAVRERSTARFVGITGSAGKTSTKDILFAICAPHRRTIANEGNYNTEIGVPLTVCRVEQDTEVAICELAMRGPGQIAWLASFVRPHVGVITNIGPAHLEFLGSLENIARTKAELVEALPPGGVAVVPREPLLEPYLQRGDVDVRHVDPDAPLPFRTSYSSAHQLANTRLAVAAAEALGVPLPDGELRVEFSKRREEERPLPGDGLLLNDCYNANPLSMRAALAHLVERAGGRRRVAVLGEMRELGPEGPAYHAEIGALVRELGIEQVIAVGELARAYGGEWVGTADEAAARLREVLRPGDAVLVKGSLAVGLEVVAENLPS
ncbi:MAG TPA: UDP-N-acetylmuramoyl-tripeptide--D-alanyl-D-alanine ligase [Gaiellaceae bacterium]|nr:UDP-N-acetylmuramoyl-tripeptide--D-alanyl-D-alanine ligase [Gaiellaceae bacterium]